MFHEPPQERSFPTTPVILAAVAVLVIVAAVVVMGHRGGTGTPKGEQPPAAYASSLEISDLKMSQSESLSGGKSTYLDGRVANHGTQTVTGLTVQALFANDAGQPPQVETAPLALIRTRQPYVDTQPVSAAPLAPGGQAEFRLIFEGVSESWNQQTPVVHVIQVSTR
ncbi:MAG TPA: DUF2393 family protein [Acidobacteriaceae bacterium]|jgi:hypothetical protein|nr:DUF2393 family protein [Acidobacteriaceae bacterium]